MEFSNSQQQLYGKYAGQDGVHGITFFSGPEDYLLVRTFSGRKVMETSPFSGTEGMEFRDINIMGYEYIQNRSSAHSDQPVDHNTPLLDALQIFLDMKEIGLLEKAAEAVGQREINGRNTPAALPFFMFALRLTQLHIERVYSMASNSTLTHHQKSKSCFDTCPPCPDDECYGLCGYECNCWEWVCGDCCFHLGCYEHDTCCREQFFQIHCLLPFGISCDSHYSC